MYMKLHQNIKKLRMSREKRELQSQSLVGSKCNTNYWGVSGRLNRVCTYDGYYINCNILF